MTSSPTNPTKQAGEVAPALLDSLAAAAYLGVNVTTLYDYVRQGLLACVKLPKRSDDRKRTDPVGTPRRKFQFRRQDLDRFIDAHVLYERETAATIEDTGRAAPTKLNVIGREWWKR
jgi:predicted site-specific integrase-resolvase